MIEDDLIWCFQIVGQATNNGREKVIQCIGWFIRGDRFYDGLLFSAVTDGTVLHLIERIKKLYDL